MMHLKVGHSSDCTRVTDIISNGQLGSAKYLLVEKMCV